MNSHDNASHSAQSEDFKRLIGQMNSAKPHAETLQQKADRMVREGASTITSGVGETPKQEIELNNLLLRHLPDDEHGITRISIGEHPEVDGSGYLVIRGSKGHIAELLRRALRAVERS